MATGLSKTKWNGNKLTGKSPARNPKDHTDVYLSYPGKKPRKEILEIPPAKSKQLWPPVGSAKTPTDNRLYFGDNLPIILQLLHDESVRNKVKLIYIDPPFATRMVYQSRSQSDAYHDLLSGSGYIEFLRERLVLLHELLADDGSIYVHLDENMAFHIKLIMDEVFGERNYRNWITRKKCNTKNYTRRTYGNISDFILFYTKSDTYIWNRPVEPWTVERAHGEYEYVDKLTGRRYKKVPIHAPGVRNGETGKVWRGMNPPPGKHWQFPPSTLDAMDERGEIYWSLNGNPRRIIFLDETSGVPIQDIWMDCRDAHNQNIKITGYPTEKNPRILNRIIAASSNPEDLVLDCFCGSGTTLASAAELNRKWIGIDNSDEAIATCLTRFAEGTKRMGDFVAKRGSTRSNLPLLDFIEVDNHKRDSTTSSNFIANFSLYVAAHKTKKLETAVEKFEKELKGRLSERGGSGGSPRIRDSFAQR
jgi:adenine-specific DNA-methyltransferase